MLVTVDRGLGKLFDLRAVLNVFEKGRQEGMQAVDLRCETVRKRQQCRKGTVKLETDLLDLSQLCQFLAVLYHILAVRLWTIHLTFLGLSNTYKISTINFFLVAIL